MIRVGKKILLVGGLGHTDLSGKVASPGLLMLRKALHNTGHDAVVSNYSTSLANRRFPDSEVKRLQAVYKRTIKPMVVDGQNPFLRFWRLPRLLMDMKNLKSSTLKLANIEKNVFKELGQELVTMVNREKFDAIGFSLYLGSSTVGSIIMADILRAEMPNLPIFFGGPQTTHFAETIYQETHAPTALVLGEGESAIVALAEKLDALKMGNLTDLANIPNLVYRANDGQIVIQPRQRMSIDQWIKISAVPYKDGDFEGVMKYAFVETSRGCSYQCRFCPQPMLSGVERYLKPATNIVNEMEELNSKFGITHFEFVGSSTPPSQAEEIANKLFEQGLENKFSWVLFMRGKDDSATRTPLPNLMEKIKKAGASAIFFGVEAADNNTLRLMGKGENIGDIKETMLAAQDAKIATIGSFIYPYPGMPTNEGELILEFLKEVRPLSAPTQALGLYPGTYCSNHASELGVEVVYPETEDQKLYWAGKKQKPSISSPEVMRYLLNYPLILSLPMRLWPPLPYKIDGMDYKKYVGMVNKLQKKIAELGILLGFSHSHHLIAQVLKMAPDALAERLFYCSLTGDPEETIRLIEKFNRNI